MKSNSKYVLIALALLVGGLAVYLSLRNSTDATPNQNETTVSSAPPASSPYMTLSDLKGNTVSMDTSKLVFFNVWATWCGPCIAEMPSIETLYERYKDNPKMEFYVVSDEEPTTVIPFLQKKEYDLPFYLSNSTYPDALNGSVIPRTYMIRNGQVLVEQIGAMNWNDPQVIDFIEEQLAR
jgi:thiol-disulfide isomerase/thioredoxin